MNAAALLFSAVFIRIFLKYLVGCTGVITSLQNYVLATVVFLLPLVYSRVIHLVLCYSHQFCFSFLVPILRNPLSENCLLSLWYLDDGTFIGSRSSLLALLSCFTQSGPSFGLHINLSKCELYWPSGDSSFPEFPHAIKQINPESSGLELLGSPVWGPPTFF